MAILLLLLISVLVFSIPAVQTKAAHELTEYLNTEFGTDIQIDKVSITFGAAIKLKDVYIADHHNDTLINAQSLETSLVNIPGIIRGENVDFGSVTIEDITFRLRRYKNDSIDSFGIFLNKLANNNPKNKGAVVSFSHINIISGKFSFVDEHATYPKIINLHNLNLDASDFVIDGSDLSIDINAMSAVGKRGIVFENLSTEFEVIENEMNFDHLNLKTSQSQIEGFVHFSFEHTMTDFANRVQIVANFKKATISTTDLNKLYGKFGSGDVLHFNGLMKGTLNDFVLQDFDLYGLTGTAVKGRVALKNIFADQGFRVDGYFDYLWTNYRDLVHLLPGILKEKLPKSLKRLGQTKLQGRISATSSMVSTNSVVHSELGYAEIEAKLFNLQSAGHETYEGQLAFSNFDIGQFLNNPDLGKTDFNFNFKGSGFDRESLNTHLNGVFSSLTFNGYTYHDIEVKGDLKSPVFTGEVISHDPNLQMQFNGSADISGKTNNYDFHANIAHADFHALNFTKDTVAVFKGQVTMGLHGHDIDDIVGSIELKNASFKNRKGTYEFKKLSLNSSFQGVVRTITINSPDIINGKIEGHFMLSQLSALFKNAVFSLYSNYKPIPIAQNQYLYFDIAIHNKIVEALFPAFTLAPDTFIRGKVHSSNSNLNLIFKSPEITIYDNKFKNVDLQLDNTNPLYTTYFDIDSVVTGSYTLSKVHLISKRKNDTLFVRTEFMGGPNNTDEFNLNLYHTINKQNKSVVGIRRSNVRFKEKTWLINKNRERQTIVFDNKLKNLKVDTIVMSYKNQKITFNGYKHGKGSKEFNLNFINVDLNEVAPTLKNFTFEGIINGKFQINQRKGIYYPTSDLTVDNFVVNDIKYGDLYLNIKGNNSLISYTVNAKMTGPQYDYMTAAGIFNVGKENPFIDINIDLHNFDIGVLNAFGNGVISNVRGLASGEAHVKGSYALPVISGELVLQNAGLKIPYLNVDMAFQDDAIVRLSQQQFYFDHVNFEDTKYHTKGQLNGTIAHHNFRDWRMNIDLLAPERLLVLDTDYTKGTLYYGTAFISGKANIRGPFDELVINVTAASERGTVFKIPLSDAETIGNNEYIYFLTPEDKLARKKGENIVFKELKGMELNFDLDINRNADIEIVVDQESGSTLRGSGAGTLLLEINTNGKFNMWGDFVVYHGTYNFKYAGLIQKEFTVVPGGTITWDGNPVRANLNVRALYQTHANPAVMLQNPTINRSIPVNVYIDLSGLLTNVDIKFDLEYPNLSSVIKSELEYRISRGNNTEIQALSLITQGSFYSALSPVMNAHPENLLYERAAGLFNDIFSGTEEKFQVGINYTKGNYTPNQEIADRVGVTLSTNVSDRILINGRVGVPVGGYRYTQSVLVGNVEIEFLLNEKGTLRAKLFNRENDIQYIGEELGYTQGIGISYSVDFNTFKELIRKILGKEISISDIPKAIEKEKKESIVPDYITFPRY